MMREQLQEMIGKTIVAYVAIYEGKKMILRTRSSGVLSESNGLYTVFSRDTTIFFKLDDDITLTDNIHLTKRY